MIELLALTVLAGVLAGLLFLIGGVLLLPVYLLVKILGLGFRITFHLLGFIVFGVLLLPIMLIFGIALVAKLFLLVLPLAIVALIVWAIASAFRTSAAPTAAAVQALPPVAPGGPSSPVPPTAAD